MPFTDVFGGDALGTSDTSYVAIALSTDITLDWVREGIAPEYPARRIMDITCSVASKTITLPDATRVSPGETMLFNSLVASTQSFTIEDAASTAVATVAVGEQWMIYLASNATEAGVWRAFCFGASTATAQASAFAGAGVIVVDGQIAQDMPVATFNTTPRTILESERGTTFVWTGTGAGEIDLPNTGDVGNGYFIGVRNDGGGNLTIDGASAEEIDGAGTKTLRPGESAILATDSLEWFTVGYGQDSVFSFDFTSIDLSAAGATYTLAGAELNRISYKFTGTLAQNTEVVVPATVQQYWVDNDTSGAFTLKLKTAGGTAVQVNQGGRSILYCNGTEVLNADTASISIPILPADGGTGQTSYTIGDLLYASGATALSKLADVATGNVLLSGGVGTAPGYGKVGLTTHVSGALPVANGGTAATDAATALTNLGAQPVDAGLTALAAFNTNGVLVQTANNTFAGRSVVAGSAKLTVTNGDGVAGNITVDFGAVASTDLSNTADITLLTAVQTLTNKSLTAPTMTGAITANGSVRGNSNTVAAAAIDCSTGNVFYKTAGGNLTWSFTNVPASSAFYACRLELTNGGAHTMTWPASVDWPSGTAPTLTASGVDILEFSTRDGGTIWRGVRVQRDSR